MRTVLRNSEGGEITHVYVCTMDGTNIYVTKNAHDRLLDMGEEEINQYYSGEDYDEIESLKEDITNLITYEVSVEKMKFRIARSIGLIKEFEILEING